MSTVSEVIKILERIAPLELAESWDNTGLLVGYRDRPVQRILTCLTLTSDVAAEAIDTGVDMVVSHHPVMFRGVKTITDVTAEGRVLLALLENRIAVYSPHTSFDSSKTGVNQGLALAFGLDAPMPLRWLDDNSDLGAGRWGELSSTRRFADFLTTIRKVGQTSYVEFCGELTRPVKKVAVACGSAADFLPDAIERGCDVFVTGEARFHSVLEARSAGIGLVLMGHYASERPAVERLATILAAETGLVASPSLAEQDPVQCFGGRQDVE